MNWSGVGVVVGLLAFLLVGPGPAAGQEDDGIMQLLPAIIAGARHRDTDGDGLPDIWEQGGYWEGATFVDLKALGANPKRKDLFIWMDYMVKTVGSEQVSLAPTEQVINDIKAVFANAPVANPDGSTGITIHPILKNQVDYKESLGTKDDDESVWRDFDALKNASFNKAYVKSHRYMIWANAYEEDDSSGLARDIPGLDFLASLGTFETVGGTRWEKLGTFVHELGHTLGLRHGGADDTNYKPNYLSIMNYSFQMSGLNIDGKWGDEGYVSHFNYLTLTLPSLNEANLDEAAGLSGGDPVATYGTTHYVNKVELKRYPANANLDWNNDSQITSGVSQDLNQDTQLTTLSVQKDWPRLAYSAGGLIGSRRSATSILKSMRMTIPSYLKNELDRATNDNIKRMRWLSDRKSNRAE